MAFVKYADCEVLNVSRSRRGQRTASAAKIGSFEYEPATDGNYLYVAVRACTADVPNLNFDMLPSWELETAYETFRGASVFLNHDNSDPAKARGVVVDAKYHDEDPDDKWVEILMEMDEDRCPRLCSLIRSGEIDTVSMGCNIQSSTCSICGNVAEYPFQYCQHIQQKGREFGGKVAFEICNGIEFFEESWVYDPADPTAHAMTMMDSEGTYTSEGCDDMGVAKWSKRASFDLPWERYGDVMVAEVPEGWFSVLVDRDIFSGEPYLTASFEFNELDREIDILHGEFEGDGYELGVKACEMWYESMFDKLHSVSVAAFSDDPRTPSPVDTKSDDESCPACGEDTFDGETCSTCGYTVPPEGMGDIDLDDEDQVEEVDDGDDDSEEGSENMGKKQKRGGRVYVVEYAYEGDSWSNYLDQVLVEADSPDEAIDIVEREVPRGMDGFLYAIGVRDDVYDSVSDYFDKYPYSNYDVIKSSSLKRVVGSPDRLLDIYVSDHGGHLYVEATVSDVGGTPLTSVELDIDVPEGWGFGDSHDFTEQELNEYGIDPSDPYGSQWAIWEYMDAFSPEGYSKNGAKDATVVDASLFW